MGRVTTPLILQSKLLCFSLLYLFISVFLALHFSLSSTKCLFRYSPFDPVQTPLFSYPSNYGEHKYAVPTHRASCESRIFFSDYWIALKEIQDSLKNSSSFSQCLRYAQKKSDRFGGNFSAPERFSFFNHQDCRPEVPCGFMKPFPVRISDGIAMENCKGVVVVSAIFGDHDKIRQPVGLGSKTLDMVCFFMFVDDTTLERLHYHTLISRKSLEYKIGAWRIVKVSGEHLYDDAAMNGVVPKFLVHRLFPNSKYSIWLDAKLQLMIDPLLLIHSLVISEGVDMAVSKHPHYIHTMEEAMATARWKKWWDIDSLNVQMGTYCENGLRPWTQEKFPYPSDVPDSSLILRKHGDNTNLFSCLLFNELEAFNPRDQLPFGFVRDHMNPKLKLNMFEVEVFERIVMEYRHNLKRGGGFDPKLKKPHKTRRARPNLSVNGTWSICGDYLREMWDESH